MGELRGSQVGALSEASPQNKRLCMISAEPGLSAVSLGLERIISESVQHNSVIPAHVILEYITGESIIICQPGQRI